MATTPDSNPSPATASTAFIDLIAAALFPAFKAHLIAKYPELAALFQEPPVAKPGRILLKVPELPTEPIRTEMFLGREFPVE
jgi:hypothetical protein